MRLAASALACLFLGACASWDDHVAQGAVDPNHKQFMTGSRLAYKGRGGPDAIKTVSAQDARDQMRSSIENRPQSQ